MTQDPEIRELAAQSAAVARAVTDVAGMAATIDRTFPALFGRLAELGVAPDGPPYIRYLGIGERLEIELGVPVGAGVDALEGVERGSLPAGRAAVLRHVGPYAGLRDAGVRLVAWVERRGEEVAGPHWEAYVTDPRTEPDASKRVTEVFLPLR